MGAPTPTFLIGHVDIAGVRLVDRSWLPIWLLPFFFFFLNNGPCIAVAVAVMVMVAVFCCIALLLLPAFYPQNLPQTKRTVGLNWKSEETFQR